MRVRFSPSPLFEVEVEGNTHVEIWEKMSEVGEIFSYSKCGCCSSNEIRPITREVDYTDEKGKQKKAYYHELQCQNPKCRARLAFGQHESGGTMFPQRKDKEGKWLDNNGWVKYVAKPKDQG